MPLLSVPRKSDPRDEKLAWLAQEDPEGTWKDADRAAEGVPLATDEEIWEAILYLTSM